MKNKGSEVRVHWTWHGAAWLLKIITEEFLGVGGRRFMPRKTKGQRSGCTGLSMVLHDFSTPGKWAGVGGGGGGRGFMPSKTKVGGQGSLLVQRP